MAEAAADLALLSTLELLPRLRAISDPTTRRRVTDEVHELHLAKWRQHSAFRGLAQHLVVDIHASFRRGFKNLVSDPGSGKVDVRAFRSLNNSLHHHHGIEDSHWFPNLRRLHPGADPRPLCPLNFITEFVPEVDILESDHSYLKSLEGKIEQGSYEALADFVALLDDHLNREEMITVPFLMDGTGGL